MFKAIFMGVLSGLLGAFSAAVPIEGAELKIRVVTENWRPYNYLENGKVLGRSTEIVKAVLDHAGVQYTIEVLPWARAYNMAQTEENVLIYTLIRIAPREHLFKWIRPLGKGGETSLYQLKGSKVPKPSSVEEAKAFKVLTNKDSMDDVWLRYSGFTNIYALAKVQQGVKALMAGGRGDFIAFDDAVLVEEFKNAGEDPGKVEKVLPLFKTPPYMAMSLKSSDEVVKRLQESYDSLVLAKKINPEQ